MPSRRKVVEFLGLERSILAVLSMAILVGLGEKMAERFLPLYLMALGGGALAVGLLNGLDNLLSALYSLPGGYASDRLGTKRALVLFNVLAMIGYAVVIVFPFWQAVIVGALFFVSWTAVSLPATMDLVASVLPAKKRTMGVSLHSFVRRVPMALGPLIGGTLIQAYGEVDGVRLAFVAALVLAGVSLVLQQLMIRDDRPPAVRPDTRLGLSLLDGALRNLLVSDVLIRFCEQIPYAFVVIWCVSLNHVTPVQFAVLTTVEMATAMLVYIPVAYLADKSTKKPFVVVTFVFFSLFPLILLVSRSFWMMVLAFVVRGLKEFGEPTRKALIMDLAPEGRKAATFGVYYLMRDVVVSIAAFGGAFLWDPSAARRVVEALGFGHAVLPAIEASASPSLNLLVAFGFGVAGTITFALFGRDFGRVSAVSTIEREERP